MHEMQQTHMHKAMARRVEAKKLLSRQTQSDYTCTFITSMLTDVQLKKKNTCGNFCNIETLLKIQTWVSGTIFFL